MDDQECADCAGGDSWVTDDTVRCPRCRNYLVICQHDKPFTERMKSISMQTGWAKGSH